MQPNRRVRRSWNWRRLARKARAGAVAAVVYLPILVFVGLIYAVQFFGRLVGHPRRARGAPMKLLGGDHGAIGRANGNKRSQSRAITEPGSRQMRFPAGDPSPEHDGKAQFLSADSAAKPSGSASREIDSAIASGLALCATPTAVIVIVEEVAIRRELRWLVLEAAFVRLIDLGASSRDVCALMQIAGYEWLYEMQIAPRRFIRLTQPAQAGGGFRWQHYATRLICFEFEGRKEQHQVLPPPEVRSSPTRLFCYFDRNDQLLGWECPREPPRRYLK